MENFRNAVQVRCTDDDVRNARLDRQAATKTSGQKQIVSGSFDVEPIDVIGGERLLQTFQLVVADRLSGAAEIFMDASGVPCTVPLIEIRESNKCSPFAGGEGYSVEGLETKRPKVGRCGRRGMKRRHQRLRPCDRRKNRAAEDHTTFQHAGVNGFLCELSRHA
jgi:hypothetical protein